MPIGRARRVVLLNDTSIHNHHGCRRVVDTIRQCLASRGLEIIDSAPACAPWDGERTLLQSVRGADLILINGEGTLHHGSKLGADLLSVVDHPARGATPVALINALYQDNPQHWGRWMSKMSLVAARDRRSQSQIQRAGMDAEFVPDLSLYRPPPGQRLNGDGKCMAYGDSVYHDVKRALRKAYRKDRKERRSRLFLPIRTSILHRNEHAPPGWYAWVDGYRYAWNVRLSSFSDANYRISADAEDFMLDLQRASLYLTGRYHGICLSMACGVPFRAVASNSFKIEALLEDAGLKAARLSNSVPEVIASSPDDWQFTAEERANLSAFLRDGRERTERLFDQLKQLAAGNG